MCGHSWRRSVPRPRGWPARRASCDSGSSAPRMQRRPGSPSWTPCSRWSRRKWRRRCWTWRPPCAACGAVSRSSSGAAARSSGGRSPDEDPAPRGGRGWPGRGRPDPRRCVRVDARHACLPGRVGPREPAPADECRSRPAARIPLRFPLRQHRRRALDGQEVRARGSTLSRLARGPGDFRPGSYRSAARLRPRLSVPPGRGRGGAQLLRAAPAPAHLWHGGVGPQLLGEPVETHLGPAYASTAKELILQDHTPSDTHLDTIISPTLFSVGTSRRLFRGMVHLTESESWRWAFQMILENTRWDLPDADVERHMAVAFEYVMELLGDADAAARRLDPAGDKALRLAKQMRRQALHEGGREDPERMLETAEHHFGLPTPPLAYWKQSQAQRPWRDREQD